MLRRGESRKQSFRAPVDPSVSAIFPDVSIRSHRSGGAPPESALEQLPATSAALPAGRSQVKTRQTRPRCSMRCMEWLIASTGLWSDHAQGEARSDGSRRGTGLRGPDRYPVVADFVAKVFLHSRSKFLLAVQATSM